MSRILGVDIPNQKKIKVSLTYIYGIGKPLALRICKEAKINPEKKTGELTDVELAQIREVCVKFPLEGDLKKTVTLNIKRLQEINCYRGIRHRKNLPTRGQRTKSNARTRKGPRKTIANKKVETK